MYYLNYSSALSTINKTLTFNLVSVQRFFIHRKGGWRLSDHLSPIYRVLGVFLPVCCIWLLFTFLILTVCISVKLCTAEVLYIFFCSLPATSLTLRNGKRKKKEGPHTHRSALRMREELHCDVHIKMLINFVNNISLLFIFVGILLLEI